MLEEPKNTFTWVMHEMSVATDKANGLLFLPEQPKLPEATLKEHLRDQRSTRVS